MAKTGPKSEYEKAGGDLKVPDAAFEMYSKGWTDAEVAKAFGVTRRTLLKWPEKHPAFAKAREVAKSAADDVVERSLFQRATGYEHEEDKVFQHEGRAVVVPTTKRYPPDTTAGIFWLKNRRPRDWRDRQVIDQTTTHEAGGSLRQVLESIDGLTKSV